MGNTPQSSSGQKPQAQQPQGGQQQKTLADVQGNLPQQKPQGNAQDAVKAQGAAQEASGANPNTSTEPASKPKTVHQNYLHDGNHIDPKTGNVLPRENAKAQTKVTTIAANPTAQIKQVDESNAKRNTANEEGHAKNMAKIDAAHERPESEPKPATGKARDLNTPVIDPVTGAKSWK